MVLILVASLAGILLFTTSIRGSNEQGVLIREQHCEEGQSAKERYEIIHAVIVKGGPQYESQAV